MRTLKGFLYLVLGGTLCGWMFNRIAAWFIDNPLTVGSNHTVAEWAVILQDPFYLDSRTMPFFFLAFGAIALVAMTKYDWTGEREEQKKLRGEEYGNQRWARDDEMQQFAHTSTVKRVPIRIPQRTRDALRFARNNPKDFIKARLGMTNKVANPKPDYVEKIEDFVGKDMKLKIIEVDEKKKRIVASRKEVLIAEEAKKKAEIWDKLEVGTVVNGIVRRLTDFGAFVDIGGVDGLVHVTDLSWGRVKHPSDVVSIGQEIPVKIQSMDRERERISLSYKHTQPKPWDVAGEKYAVGSIVEGKVVRITTFGAFVELEPGLDGLVHISQCALTRIAKVEDAVQVGDVVRVKVLDVNTDAKRISLSIRAVLEDEAFDGVEDGAADSLGDEFAIGDEGENN